MSLLDLVVPAEKGISENCVSKSELLSGRDLEKGMEMTQPVKTDSSYASSLLFQQYLMDKLGCYTNPGFRRIKIPDGISAVRKNK